MTIEEILSIPIKEPDEKKAREVKAIWDSIAKPLDSLGRFEEIICRIGGITKTTDISIEKRGVIVMCADNGIVAEHISQSSQEVTAMVARNMARGASSVCRMAKGAHAHVLPVDIGIRTENAIPGLLQRRIASGTRNFLIEPAMTLEETAKAIEVGMELAGECRKQGYDILATGEMGIGNTTTSCAVTAALTGCPPEEFVGKGAGLSREGIHHKIQVIKTALRKYAFSREETLRILASVGGLDIAGLVGVFMGGARYEIPIVLDGVVSAAAALAAERLLPGCRAYMLASHRSRELAAAIVMEELKLHPVIEAELALGEGTGAVMLFPLLDLVLSVYRGGTTFQEIRLEPYQRFDQEGTGGAKEEW